MSDPNPNPKIIIALDYASASAALALVNYLDPKRCALKVGKELFTRAGPALVETLVKRGYRVFLDLKFRDIPNTVAAACEAAADLGVWMVNLHASGGRRMMEVARERLANRAQAPLLIAVTVLTSLDGLAMEEVGLAPYPEVQVLRLAKLAQESGMDGIVCSPKEVAPVVRRDFGQNLILVTPGVRSPGVPINDQKRVMTPREALIVGSDYLVIGRQVTSASDPMAALATIEEEIDGV